MNLKDANSTINSSLGNLNGKLQGKHAFTFYVLEYREYTYYHEIHKVIKITYYGIK